MDSIEIAQSWHRALYRDSLFKQMVVLKNKEGEVFSHGTAPISYNWVSLNQDVLLPHPQFSDTKDLLASHPHQLTQMIRDNARNDNYASF